MGNYGQKASFEGLGRSKQSVRRIRQTHPFDGRILKGGEEALVRNGGAVQGLDLVKDLVELEAELSRKLDEANRSAEQRVTAAKQEAQRILAEADAQIHQMADTWKARIAEESEKYTEDGRLRAETEAKRIREQAERNIDQAVNFILSEVLP